ncbi:hypothetical protein [Arthrobacter polaris]|uniref:hypothetical protein n=1 Tax=Arthrobacter polaris TaxID=2813727 RepID=UPI001F33B6C9|nr:hypothetical protein [Arthrobacter polaris]UIK89125.1 hypothetical protein J0916_01125 [Arthrobacter polaris]
MTDKPSSWDQSDAGDSRPTKDKPSARAPKVIQTQLHNGQLKQVPSKQPKTAPSNYGQAKASLLSQYGKFVPQYRAMAQLLLQG